MPAPTIIASKLQQHQRMDQMRDLLRRANVPDDQANQALQDEQNYVSFLGRVVSVTTTDTLTTVLLTAQSPYGRLDMLLEFPPNKPRYLSELIRAHNHMHLRVLVEAHYDQETFKGTIRGSSGISVFWDDHQEQD